MTFASAGPHHVLGTAPDGIQLDIVGHPPSEAVLSVPAAAGRDPTGMAAPYLPALAAFVGAPPSATVTWIQGRLASWQPPATLSAATTLGGVRIELRTIEGYLRLRLTTG
jgi:hypothetical protein